ncbi:MAG: carotenoid oxygenase family protein [Acidimicrobiales bacterium]|nr:carotenoid oxygenase family protein [Acidimicrobiales bacterium]MCB9371462.1 carotenoid oxygenase family protein [Microthrixaceae bacterium]
MPTPDCLTTAPHRDFDLRVVSGAWPADVSGEMLFSAPRLSGGLPYGIFDFGAVARLSLTPGTHGAPDGRFAWRVASIETPSKRIFDAAPEAFTAGPVGYTSPFGAPNATNTAPLPWGDRLFTTWDAGRPVEIHPGTLEYVAEVGHIDSWGGPSMFGDTVLPFLFSSAHPVADPDRDGLWTTKLEPVMEPTFGMRPSVVWWDRDGTEVKWWPLEGIAFAGSTHTVSQTRDWVILCDSGNFRADPDEMFGGERTVTVDDAAPVWLVRKDELLARPSGTPVTPSCFTVSPPNGHFYARYDDTDGISVVWEGMDLMDLALYVRPDDVDVHGAPVPPASVGLYNMAMAPETIAEVVFDPESGKLLDQGRCREDWTFNLQLSAMDWSTEGMSAPTLHHVSYQGCRPGRVTARAARLYEGRIDLDDVAEETPGYLATFERGSMALKSRWEYADTSDLITSPTFAPRSNGADPSASAYAGGEPGGHDGYVVQPVLSDDGFRVELFDAAQVGAGPIAVLEGTANECVPLLLHSAWMPTVDELADADRLRFSDELTEARLAGLDDDQRRVVAAVAEELDG